MKNLLKLSFTVILIFTMAGCGYTSKSLLPPDLDSIYVENFKNDIDLSTEVTDKRASYSYRPGLETDITRSVIDGFIFDRHLDVRSKDTAKLILKGALESFRQYPLSYNDGKDVEEFRIEILVDVELYDTTTGKSLWVLDNFMGETTYTISGPNSKSEAEALNDAVKDLAQRLVERTVEAW